MKERWVMMKDQKNYLVSNAGTIINLDKMKIMKLMQIGSYKYIKICGIYHIVHHIVILSFRNNVNNYHFVNHINGNTNDNCLKNLKYSQTTNNKENLMIQNNKEQWKIVYNNRNYIISNFGNVISIRATTIMKQLCFEGYKYAKLYYGDKFKYIPIHHLVMLSFQNNINNRPCVEHINGCTRDNRLNNLQYVGITSTNLHMSICTTENIYDTGTKTTVSYPIHVYKIVNLEDDHIYVGSTKFSLTERFKGHVSNYLRGKFLTSAILFNRYGVENCSIELIKTYYVNSYSEQLIKERFHYDELSHRCVNATRAICTIVERYQSKVRKYFYFCNKKYYKLRNKKHTN
jgi:hypothetical protein